MSVFMLTEQGVCVLETQRLRRVRVLQECGVVDADLRMLGELPESERGVEVQLPALLLSAPTQVLLRKKRERKKKEKQS